MDPNSPGPAETPTADTGRDAALAMAAELHKAVGRLVATLAPTVQAFIQAYGQLGKQLYDAGVIDEHGQPTGTASEKGELATTDDVAEYLGVPVKTLYQWRWIGKGPKANRVGRRLRYRWADVEAWVDSQAEPQEHGHPTTKPSS